MHETNPTIEEYVRSLMREGNLERALEFVEDAIDRIQVREVELRVLREEVLYGRWEEE
jgi:hypothetical protein